MKFFLDTADIREVQKAADSGLLDGVTISPGHIAGIGRTLPEVLLDVVGIVSAPILVEVTAVDLDGMMNQAHELADIASHIVVQISCTDEGLKAVRLLSAEGIKTSVTQCLSPVQALLVAKAGATYVAWVVESSNALDPVGLQGIRDIRKIYDNYHFGTQIMVAVARNPVQVREAALIGADVVAMEWNTFTDLVKH